MNERILSRLALIGVITVVCLSLAGAILAGVAGQATAQEIDQNATTTPEPAIEGAVGPVEILDYEVRDGTMTLTLRTDEHTAYAVTDALAGLEGEGVSEISYKQAILKPGKTTVKLPVTVRDDAAAVTLSTPNDAVRIQTAPVAAGKRPVDYETAQLLLGGAAVFGAAGTFVYVKRRREEENREVRRTL